MIGGSADLTHSNPTQVKAVDSDFTPSRAGAMSATACAEGSAWRRR